MKKHITTNYKQTQKLGNNFAKEIFLPKAGQPRAGFAVIIGLSGNLGGGKTTFLQGFAKGLGIKEKILSPTFVIMKHFKLQTSPVKFQNLPVVQTTLSRTFHDRSFNFYHFDCYRINKPEEILELGWKEIVSNPKNIIAVEWPEKIKKVLPKNTIYIEFKFINETTRELTIGK